MLHISSWCNWSLVCWNWDSIHQGTIERCTYLYTHACAYEISRILHVCLIKISVFIFWCAWNCIFGQNMEGLVTYTTGKIFSQFLIFKFILTLAHLSEYEINVQHIYQHKGQRGVPKKWVCSSKFFSFLILKPTIICN